MDKPWHTAAPNFSIQGILRGPDKSKAASNNAVWNISDSLREKCLEKKKRIHLFWIQAPGGGGRHKT